MELSSSSSFTSINTKSTCIGNIFSHSKVDAALVAGSTSEANLQKIFVCIDLQGPKEVFSLKTLHCCLEAVYLTCLLPFSYRKPEVF